MTDRTVDVPAAKRRYHHGDLAEALAAAAGELIEEVGPARLSLSECCRRAGVSTAAPYKHFRDKGALIDRVALEGFAALAEATAAAREARRDAPAVRRIAAMGSAYVRFALARPGLFSLMFGATAETDREDPALEAAGRACFSVLIDAVADAIGDDGERARRLSATLWTFVHGAAALAQAGNYEAAGIETDVDAMIESATERLLADHAPDRA
ncbi:MAG: WHG domain-containing protein [Paracoccaceae bacterium]